MKRSRTDAQLPSPDALSSAILARLGGSRSDKESAVSSTLLDLILENSDSDEDDDRDAFPCLLPVLTAGVALLHVVAAASSAAVIAAGHRPPRDHRGGNKSRPNYWVDVFPTLDDAALARDFGVSREGFQDLVRALIGQPEFRNTGVNLGMAAPVDKQVASYLAREVHGWTFVDLSARFGISARAARAACRRVQAALARGVTALPRGGRDSSSSSSSSSRGGSCGGSAGDGSNRTSGCGSGSSSAAAAPVAATKATTRDSSSMRPLVQSSSLGLPLESPSGTVCDFTPTIVAALNSA